MRHAATLLVALGGAVLAAWIFGWTPVTTIHDGWPAMQPWTAIGFVALGVAMRWWRSAAWVTIYCSIASLLAYVFGPEALVVEPDVFTGAHGPMAMNTAACMAMAAIAALQKSLRVRGWIGAAIVATAGVALSGYIFGIVEARRWIDQSIGMAMHTSLGLLVAAGWLIQSARRGCWHSGPSLGFAASVIVGLECLRVLIAIQAPAALAWGAFAFAILLGTILSTATNIHYELKETVDKLPEIEEPSSQPPRSTR